MENESALPIIGPLEEVISIGLTKRELFAAMAMQGICANEGAVTLKRSVVAALAVTQADALLAALATPSEERKP